MALLQVCLVDELPIVGYLSAILKKPDAIVWLRTPEQKRVVELIQDALKSRLATTFESREVPRSDIEALSKQCEAILRDYPQYDVVLNVSGGTRLQALLTAEIFKKAGKDVVYIDLDQSRIVDVKTGEHKTFQPNLFVNEYIALHGVKVESGTRFDPEIGKRSALSYFIGYNLDQVVPFIDKIRPEWNDMGETKKSATWKTELGSQRFSINYNAEEKKMRFRFGSSENAKTIEIPDEGANYNGAKYIFNGGWLRELVFLRVHRIQYDDARLNVRLARDSMPENSRGETMLDITLMRNCSFYVMQCFSYPITKDSFYELQAVHETIELLKAHGIVFCAHRPHRAFLERAHDLGIEVVTGRKIANFSL